MAAVPPELTWLVDAFVERHPECDVEFTEFHFSDPLGLATSGAVDLQVMWRPVPSPGLRSGPTVLTEGRLLAVPADSELAGRSRVSLEGLAGRTVPDGGPLMPQEWLHAICPKRTPDGRMIHRGPQARTFHELLALVAAGRAVSPVNEHVLKYYTFPGVVLIPIEDAPVTEWALALPDTVAPPPHVNAFVRVAEELGPRAVAVP
ncbi:hypothetical protein N802_05890 [Knoellia sinensis KCTC 19936]|uniref:LysR substrate-binding domain-containing protein n=1 Tax=Knoellia sinensis KCTC 19936 TaxID=1385520 RepID=A0A0A0IZW6_9MICO|nr:hypothetical protein N802_05890 [Knoellia sinensis KCTC 19936]